jgi:hypothetical protein
MILARSMVCALLVWLGLLPDASAADIRSQRILVEYQQPKDAAHRILYEEVKTRRVLERLQEIFGPFRLPTDLIFEIAGCDGRANAWYHRPTITICYEYLDEIRQNVPKGTTPAGVTPADAMVGQFFYVVAHEFGHAVFDLLQLPSFGRFEDIADQFSAYMMLQAGREEARRLIAGAAYSYKSILGSSTIINPLEAFSDVHGLPQQRFFNLLCIAYGSDPEGMKDIVEKRYLPMPRADDCTREFNQVAFAFEKLVEPHIDEDLKKRAWSRSWLAKVAK